MPETPAEVQLDRHPFALAGLALTPNPRRPTYILTVHGLGYKFVG